MPAPTDAANRLPSAGRHRARRRLLLLAPVILLALGSGLALLFFGPLLFGPLPGLDRMAAPAVPATRILDRNGLLLYEIADPARGNYQPISLADMPLACRQATIATEDKRFYQHPGVDLLAILRAAWADWRHGAVVQGGSTLTQQLARLLLLDESERYERSLRRKLREALLAWRLEHHLAKDEILALYLNNIYYGHFATGIEAAARSYFGRPAAELDLAQCALLAGLPQAPVAYNPIENADAARARQQQVLHLMVEAGYLDRDEARRTAAEPLHFAATPFPISAPHFVFYVQGQVERALGRDHLARGGLSITTTLDLPLTQAAEAAIRRRLAEMNRPGPDLPIQRRAENAALVALDPVTGALLAFVGSPDYFAAHISGALNAALAWRQPGSALKPLTYAIALDPGLSAAAGRDPFTAATVLADVPATFITREGDPYRPLNYDQRFHGPVSVRAALANSYNIPAVRTLEAIGIDALLTQARRHGITTFGAAERYGLALTLGGGEVNLLELTAAYAPFAHAGQPVQPLAIARIEDREGQLLFDAGLYGRQVYNPAGWNLPTAVAFPAVLDPHTADLVTDILADNDARAASFGFSSPLRLERPAAAKTGTTTDWRDNWTIGFTPDLLAGVWVGNADNTPMYGASGIDGAAPIWRDFMTVAHKTLPVRPFFRSDDLVERDICTPSGLLAAPDCPQVRRELFIAGTEPTRADDQYQRIAIDLRSGQPALAGTPAAALGQRVAWNPPPLLRDWAQQEGLLLAPADLHSLPPLRRPPPALSSVQAGQTLQLLSPGASATYLIDPRLPAQAQRLQLAISYIGEAPLIGVAYIVDGVAIAEVGAWPWSAWWDLAPGSHTVQAVGRSDDEQPILSPVVSFRVE